MDACVNTYCRGGNVILFLQNEIPPYESRITTAKLLIEAEEYEVKCCVLSSHILLLLILCMCSWWGGWPGICMCMCMHLCVFLSSKLHQCWEGHAWSLSPSEFTVNN